MHAGLAGLSGRPDLGSAPSTPQKELDAPRASSDAPGFSANVAGDLTVGRLSAGELGLLVIGLGLFYFWTRTHQS